SFDVLHVGGSFTENTAHFDAGSVDDQARAQWPCQHESAKRPKEKWHDDGDSASGIGGRLGPTCKCGESREKDAHEKIEALLPALHRVFMPAHTHLWER